MRATRFAILLTGCSVFAASAAIAQTAEEQRSDGLDDIVVTAQRVEQKLQDVPVAVTAMGEEEIADKRISSAKDLAGLAPNLAFSQQGNQSNPTLIIRGISSGTSNNAVDPKVGVYVDGVYVGRTVGSLFDLADITRVEVLRGPQGTLFGRNATGGAISLTTATPSGEWGGRASLSYGNYNALRGKISLDLPQFGPFSVRLAYLHDEIDGYVKNSLAGRTIDISPRAPEFGVLRYTDKLGKRNVDGGQISVRGEFGDVTADYKFDYSDQNGTSTAFQNYGPIPDATGALLNGILAFQAPGAYNTSITPLKTVANATSNERVVSQGHGLTITIPTDHFTVKNILAYRKMRQDPSIYDLAGSGGLKFTLPQLQNLLIGNIPGVLDPANQPGPNDAFHTLLVARSSKQWQISNEFQIQFQREGWDLTTGIFIFHENSPATDILGAFHPVTNGVMTDLSNVGTIPGLPAGPLPFDINGDGVVNYLDYNPGLDATFGSGVTRTLAVNDSFAGYAQFTLHLTDRLDVALGGRYTIDDRMTRIDEIAGAQGGALGVGTYKATYKKFNYAGIVTWRPTDDITSYARVSTGYVAGGILSGIPYKPENLTSYELGLKSDWFDRKLRVNLAAFYSDYKDLQTQNFINGRQMFDNAGKAKVKGFEAEVALRPMRGLTLSGSAGYNDFKYKKFILNGVDVTNIADPVYLAKWTGRAEAAYETDASASGLFGFGRIGASYRGPVYLTSLPIVDTAGNISPIEQYRRRPGFWMVDGRVGLGGVSLGGAKMSLSAFGKNLTNERPNVFGASVMALSTTFERGRTYGLELSAEF